MAVNRSDFQHLETKYGRFVSWAIWNPTNRKCPKIIDDKLARLNPSIVMIGLNVSANLENSWSNFHIGRNDGKLMYAFNDSDYRGAYMTDLIKEEVEPNSKKIMDRIRSGELDVKPHVSVFLEEMADIGANDNSLFIIFGGDASAQFRKHLGKKFPNRVFCRHYSDRVRTDRWAIETLEKLAHHRLSE